MKTRAMEPRLIQVGSFVAKKAEPTPATICEFLTEQVRGYFSNPALVDNDMGVQVKPKRGQKKKKNLTPQQRAVFDFGGTWALETFGEGDAQIQAEVYTWQNVRMRFFMADKSFRRI